MLLPFTPNILTQGLVEGRDLVNFNRIAWSKTIGCLGTKNKVSPLNQGMKEGMSKCRDALSLDLAGPTR